MSIKFFNRIYSNKFKPILVIKIYSKFKLFDFFLLNFFRFDDCVELLLKHGARVDVEARMCWPGPHNQNCEERGHDDSVLVADRSSDKLQSAVFYAIDGDQVNF